MLSNLQNSVISAVLLVFIVIIGILGFRAASLVGVSIPGSFLLGILVIASFGTTINMMVLFALIMAVGLLVDGAIVVTELADRRMAEGIDRHDAYSGAARRMSLPIIASTCTTLAAFVPLVFWPGIMGEFMKFLPITLVAVLSASLLMALLFVPTLGSIFGKTGAISSDARRNLTAAETGDLDTVTGVTGSYIQFLKKSLRHPWLNVGAVSLVLVSIYIAFFAFGRGVELFPEIEPEFANLDIHARGDLSTDEKDVLVRQVEAYVLDLDEVESVYAKTGAVARGAAEDLIGSITLNFIEWDERRKADLILDDIRNSVSGLAGVQVRTRKAEDGPQQGKPILIELSSRFPKRLEDATARIRAALESIDGLFNIDDTRPLPGIEWQIDVDRAQAAKFGADITLVGNMIQLVTNGIKIGEYRPDDAEDEIDIRVRYPYDSRSLDQIDALRIPTDEGLIPISNFVQRIPANKVSTIQRTNLRRTMRVGGSVFVSRQSHADRDSRYGNHPRYAIQQSVPGIPDPDRGFVFHRRRPAWPSRHEQAIRHRDERCRRHYARWHCRQQQHCVYRHLQCIAQARCRCLRSNTQDLCRSLAAGVADHGNDDSRTDADGVCPQHRSD
jgi:multidrug efflux pump